MDILDHKTDDELLQSVIAELAKSKNELRCASQDIAKANNRLSFALLSINTILDRRLTGE